MITFRRMDADEFHDYKAYFVADYAHEIGTNYGYTDERA